MGGASLVELFVRIARKRESGILEVRKGEELSRVYFRDGHLVGAAVHGAFKPLGVHLLEAGLIDIESLNHSLTIKAQANVPQGQVLVELGAITPAQLELGLMDQVVSRAGAFLLLEEGEWTLTPEGDYPTWTADLRIHPGRALLGVFRRPEAARLLRPILETLSSSRLTLRVEAPEVTDHFPIGPLEARCLGYFDGSMDLPAVGEASGLPIEHLLALVAGLSLFQLIASAGGEGRLTDLLPEGGQPSAVSPPPTPAPPATVSPPATADPALASLPTSQAPSSPRELFEQGMKFFQREEFESALPFLRDAVHADPGNGLWTAYFAWALYSVGPAEEVAPRVKQMLELATESEEGGERARYYLGKIVSRDDDSLDAWI